MTSYDDHQATPSPCLCGRKVSNRPHCARWAAGHTHGAPNLVPLHELPDCPLETYHGRRYAQPDQEDCE